MLLERAQRGDFLVAVPEVVIQEVLKQYEVRYDERTRKAGRAMRGLREFGLDVTAPRIPSTAEALVLYEAELRRRLHQENVLIPALPTARHDDVLERAIKRRKPFKESGAGYQDTLIWLTILEQAEAGFEPIVLISENTSDFGELVDGDWVLASDLREDAEQAGIEPGAVVLYPSLQQFLGENVEPDAEDLDEARRLITEERDAIANELAQAVLRYSPATDLTLVSAEIEVAEWESIDIGEIDVTSSHGFDEDDELVAYLTAPVTGSVRFALERRAADRLPPAEKRLVAEWTGESAAGTKRIKAAVDAELVWPAEGDDFYLDVFDLREIEDD